MTTRHFATCARGLEPILAQELVALGASSITPGRGGVAFEGGQALVYQANLWLRTAVRVLQPVLEADVRSTDELYDSVRSVDWSAYMTPDHTLAVDCNVRNSSITHSQYAARRVKDAICDQFRERVGRRPSVDTERPGIGINLHIAHDHAILSLDSSWDSLHKRGYRPVQTRAPLNEALAAGLLLHLGYDGSVPLYDPMCGSGTFAIEGAWIALHRPPGLTRKWFGFYGWLDFDKSLWSAIRDEARRGVRTTLPCPIGGSDVRTDAFEFARGNARTAGVGNLLNFNRQDLKQARPPAGPPGLLISNPPYGERLGEEKELEPLYRSLGDTFAARWPCWKLALFTANDRLARKVGLLARRSTPFFNGSLMCKLWEFEAGS
jgi:putative N6-adenine-specific DNA methylase